MKYICLGYFNPQEMDSRPKADMDKLMQDCQPHMETLYKTGKVLMDAGLSTDVRLMRRTGGKVITTDGPFIETKEMLGGVFIVEADNMDQASKLAALHPTTQVAMGEALGWRLEIRPIDYFKE